MPIVSVHPQLQKDCAAGRPILTVPHVRTSRAWRTCQTQRVTSTACPSRRASGQRQDAHHKTTSSKTSRPDPQRSGPPFRDKIRAETRPDTKTQPSNTRHRDHTNRSDHLTSRRGNLPQRPDRARLSARHPSFHSLQPHDGPAQIVPRSRHLVAATFDELRSRPVLSVTIGMRLHQLLLQSDISCKFSSAKYRLIAKRA